MSKHVKTCDLINQINKGTPKESWYCRTHSEPYYPNKSAKSNTPKIDEILKKLYSHHLTLVAYLLDNRAPDPKFSEKVMLAEAKQQLYQLILEVIGTNDRDYSKDNADEESLKILVATSTACNELRQEQRQKLSDLFNIKETK